MDFPSNDSYFSLLNLSFVENCHISIFTTFAKQSMINRLSNPINRNRSAAKISKVMSSNVDGLGRLLSFPTGSVSGPAAAYHLYLMQAWDQVALHWKTDSEIGNNWLHFPASFHSAEAFLRDGASKKIEDFDFTIQTSPDTKALHHHFVFVIFLFRNFDSFGRKCIQ